MGKEKSNTREVWQYDKYENSIKQQENLYGVTMFRLND